MRYHFSMAKWMVGVCDTGTAEIHYLRTGGTGPAVILLHGLTGNGACWSPVARGLETDFDVIMMDARGHGRSGTPPRGYLYPDHASDVAGLIRDLDLATPILVGHSMGGMTAALTASQLGELIRGLILVDPTFLTPQRQREVYDSDVAEQHRRLLSRNRDDVLTELRARHSRRSSEMVELLTDARFQTRMNAFDVLTPPNPEYRTLVSNIRVPVLIVLGDTPVVSLETARELQSLNPRVRVEQIQDAGHGLPYDQPERLAAVVRAAANAACAAGRDC
jgi:N-formylmaleamate deformylase